MEYKGFEVQRDPRIQSAWLISHPSGGNISNVLKGQFTSLSETHYQIDSYLAKKEAEAEMAKEEKARKKAEKALTPKVDKEDAKTEASSSDSKLPEGEDNGGESSELPSRRAAVGK